MTWAAWLVASVVLAPVLLAFVNRATVTALPPGRAVGVRLGAELIVAAATACAAAVLAWPLIARLSIIGRLGSWAPARVEHVVGIPLAVSAGAALLAIAMIGNVALTISRQCAGARGNRAARRAIGEATDVVVVADSTPYAHALYAWRRADRLVVLSSGLVDSLPPDQVDAVVAHERSHLTRHHALYELASEISVAINPLLRWTAADLHFVIERWADEDASERVGRLTVAHALGRASLARLAGTGPSGSEALYFSRNDIPARVEALVRDPEATRWARASLYAVVLVPVVLGVLHALEHTEDLVEALQHFR